MEEPRVGNRHLRAVNTFIRYASLRIIANSNVQELLDSLFGLCFILFTSMILVITFGVQFAYFILAFDGTVTTVSNVSHETIATSISWLFFFLPHERERRSAAYGICKFITNFCWTMLIYGVSNESLNHYLYSPAIIFAFMQMCLAFLAVRLGYEDKEIEKYIFLTVIITLSAILANTFFQIPEGLFLDIVLLLRSTIDALYGGIDVALKVFYPGATVDSVSHLYIVEILRTSFWSIVSFSQLLVREKSKRTLLLLLLAHDLIALLIPIRKLFLKILHDQFIASNFERLSPIELNEIQEQGDENCSVCLNPHDGESVRLRCSHILHSHCLSQILQQSSRNRPSRCPMCRASILNNNNNDTNNNEENSENNDNRGQNSNNQSEGELEQDRGEIRNNVIFNLRDFIMIRFVTPNPIRRRRSPFDPRNRPSGPPSAGQQTQPTRSNEINTRIFRPTLNTQINQRPTNSNLRSNTTLRPSVIPSNGVTTYRNSQSNQETRRENGEVRDDRVNQQSIHPSYFRVRHPNLLENERQKPLSVREVSNLSNSNSTCRSASVDMNMSGSSGNSRNDHSDSNVNNEGVSSGNSRNDHSDSNVNNEGVSSGNSRNDQSEGGNNTFSYNTRAKKVQFESLPGEVGDSEKGVSMEVDELIEGNSEGSNSGLYGSEEGLKGDEIVSPLGEKRKRRGVLLKPRKQKKRISRVDTTEVKDNEITGNRNLEFQNSGSEEEESSEEEEGNNVLVNDLKDNVTEKEDI